MNRDDGYPPLPEDKRCSSCQGTEFILAVDKTVYTPVSTTPGDFETGGSYLEDVAGPETVQFFCVACGEHFQVPEELA